MLSYESIDVLIGLLTVSLNAFICSNENPGGHTVKCEGLTYLEHRRTGLEVEHKKRLVH